MRGGLLDGCCERDLPGAAGTGRVDIVLGGRAGDMGMIINGRYLCESSRICSDTDSGGLRVLGLLRD